MKSTDKRVEKLQKKYKYVLKSWHWKPWKPSYFWVMEDGWYNLCEAFCVLINHEVNKYYSWWERPILIYLWWFEEIWNKFISTIQFDWLGYNPWRLAKENKKAPWYITLISKMRIGRYGIFQLTDCKEKYGTLRLYCSGTSEMYDIEEWVCQLSAMTCDVCGEWGEIRSGGWVRTLCDKHAKERGGL